MNTQDFFTKVNLDFSDVDVDSLSLKFSHSYLLGKSGIFEVYHPEFDFVDAIKSRLPESFQSWIRNVRIVSIQGDYLNPHIDSPGDVRINFYLISSNARTCFWSAKPNATTVPLPKENTNPVYRAEDLILECEFVAENHSCYVLNTSKIHSVVLEKQNSQRKILQLTFDHNVTYHAVLKKLSELNLIT